MAVLTVGLHAQFTTIAAAVAAAASGDTINVTADHTYLPTISSRSRNP